MMAVVIVTAVGVLNQLRAQRDYSALDAVASARAWCGSSATATSHEIDSSRSWSWGDVARGQHRRRRARRLGLRPGRRPAGQRGAHHRRARHHQGTSATTLFGSSPRARRLGPGRRHRASATPRCSAGPPGDRRARTRPRRCRSGSRTWPARSASSARYAAGLHLRRPHRLRAVIRDEVADRRPQRRDRSSYVLDAVTIAITIVVVAVPEGLPLAVTISLAYTTRQDGRRPGPGPRAGGVRDDGRRHHRLHRQDGHADRRAT